MKMYDTTQSVEKYLNVELECDCGRTHYAPIKACAIGPGALDRIVDFVREYGYEKPYILCDRITYQVAGEKCERLLKEAGYTVKVLIIKHMGFDEATLGEIVINKPDDCDLMIGCGTGSITDMLRYSSFKLGLPCFTVATGAPMDGFSASVGIMNVDNLKATMPAHSTEVIIGDTDVLSGAPYRMSIAGFDDLIGKYTALNDWRIAVIANGDHYCDRMYWLVKDYVDAMMGRVEAIKNKDPEALGEIFNSLLLTGATISLYGTSRPISGSEHHISHYWEALGDERGKPFAMHGEQVAVGTVLSLMFREELRERSIDFAKAREKAAAFDKAHWLEEVKRVYSGAADAIIAVEEKAGKNDIEGRLARIDVIERRWDEIKALLDSSFSSVEMRDALKTLGSPADPIDIGVDAALLRDSIIYCKETRNVYTVYSLAWDLGLMEEVADAVIEKLKSLGRV